ncbi:MAG: hypothetical protein WKF79_06260 [Nocardioides sp.]
MRTFASLTTALVALASVAACSSDGTPSATDPSTPATESSSAQPEPGASVTVGASPTASPSAAPEEPAGTTLEVTIAGDDVGPNGETIELGLDETLTITITSDRAGELHIHAKPEQYVEFPEGQSTQEIKVETPGVVDIEEHDTGVVVAQLSVQ